MCVLLQARSIVLTGMYPCTVCMTYGWKSIKRGSPRSSIYGLDCTVSFCMPSFPAYASLFLHFTSIPTFKKTVLKMDRDMTIGDYPASKGVRTSPGWIKSPVLVFRTPS